MTPGLIHWFPSASAACLVALGAVVSLEAQDKGFWAFLQSGRVVTRCAESSVAHQQAVVILDRLDEQIERLKNVSPKAEVEEALRALLKSECFLAAAETRRVPRPDSSESLQRWWWDGGHDWLQSYLELPRAGPISELVSHIVVPPDTRRSLHLDSHREHSLSSLLCAMTDAACGAVTRGWKSRADAHFVFHRALHRNDSMSSDEQPQPGISVTSRQCAEKASSSGRAGRYLAWRNCIESQRPKRLALPLGEFKAPADGWLVISGRRGHYDFCDKTTAYNLANGAAFISESCSALALRRNGSVDFDATDRARVALTKAGTLPVENLREALWMMLFRGEAEEIQVEAAYYPLPAGFIPQVTVEKSQDDFSGVSISANTSQTFLTWRWMPPTSSAFVGELTWPNSYDAAEDHTVSLLNIAETGFVEGCAAERVPPPTAFSSRRARNLNDVSEKSIKELDQDFAKAFDKWQAIAPCRLGAR